MFEYVMFKYVHSSADGYLDYSCVWAIVNSAAIHICVQVLFRRLFQFFEYAFKNEILGLYGNPSFKFFLHLTTFNMVSLVAQMVKHLPAMRETWVQSLG